MAIWDDNSYKNVFPPAYQTGAWHTCAQRRGTTPAQIEYKRTTDLAAWPADSVVVGTISSTKRICAVTFGSDGLVIVSNGYEFFMQSEAQGIDGSWEAVS